MDELKRWMSLIDFNEPYNVRAHEDIYSSVLSHPLSSLATDIRHPDVTDLVDALPSEDPSSMNLPPELVFYGARNILWPTFIVGQIPDLLNLLALVETFRRIAMVKSDEALEWQTYYERTQSDDRELGVRLLTVNEVCELKGFLNGSNAQRREYIDLVRNLILLYIHYLRTAPESCLIWKRFNDFFPGSIEGFDGPSGLLFHVDLSEDEKACFQRLKIECQEWLKLAADWDSKQEEMFREEGISTEDMVASFTDEFRDVFPPPCERSHMTRNVEIYINKVEKMVRKLEQWFPPSSEVSNVSTTLTFHCIVEMLFSSDLSASDK